MPHGSGSGQHVNDWLAGQKDPKTKIIPKANGYVIPTDRVKSRRAAQPAESKKPRGAPVKRTDTGPTSFNAVVVVFLCLLAVLFTFFGTVSLMVVKPEMLQLPFELVQKAIIYTGAL